MVTGTDAEHDPPGGRGQGARHTGGVNDVPGSVPDPSTTEPAFYRLAPAVTARLVGLAFLVLALTTFAITAVVLAAGWAPDLIVLTLALELAVVFGAAGWLRSRAYVVRLDDVGYSVRLVRGAGVKDGRWSEVSEAVAAHPHEIACLVLKRTDGTTTSIPVGMLAADRDDFARDVGSRLSRAHR